MNKTIILIFTILFVIILLDQITKEIALKKCKSYDKRFLNGHLRFTYLENKGSFLGLFEKHYFIVLLLSSIILLIAIFYMIIKFNAFNIFMHIAFAIFIGGGIGNYIDRIFRHYVIDFICIKFIKKETFVFNLADLFIFIGAILFLIGVIFIC